MAERPDPDTDPYTLADRIWATTDMMYDHEAMVDDVTAGDLRAAADGLRQLAAITAALGDPDELRYHARGDVADTGGGDDLQARLRAIADAAGSLSPTPTPDHCPTCDICGGAKNDPRGLWAPCPDAWHDSGQP